MFGSLNHAGIKASSKLMGLEPSFAQFPSNWLTELFRTLVTQKSKEDFCKALASCRFITFNYDRVIEQFFHQATKCYFDLSSIETDELCEKHLNVIHVYGGLGKINCADSNLFGQADNEYYLIEAAKKIRTFTEGVDDHRQMMIAKNWIRTADVVLFVGFGFLPLNLKALAPEKGENYPLHKVFGTIKNMPANNVQIARNLLRNHWYGGDFCDFEFDDVAGNELVWRNSMYLAEADVP